MSSKVTSKHLTKAEKEAKLSSEEALKGETSRIVCPKYLTEPQRKIFRYIISQLKASDILGNLDIYILAECSIAIDRMREIEKMINFNPELIQAKELGSAKDRYSKIFFRCCNERCLSPQSRAKIGNISMQAEKENPLLKVLLEDD